MGRIPDPRRVRGRHYSLGSLLTLCLVAVLGGATSLAGIVRFAADTDSEPREQLGLTSRPNASTLGRLLARRDGDALDDAVGAWLARYAADPVDEPGDTLGGPAVDDKAVRGSRTDGTAVHLLAAALHACQTVTTGRQIATKSNEIPAFAPLLNRIDLRGVVVTADTMQTQRAHAEHVITAGGHYRLVMKGNQKSLRKQLRRLPWKQIPLQARTTGAGHGPREIRRLKGLHRPATSAFPARRSGHGNQAPPHARQDRQGPDPDRLRDHQFAARAGRPATARRTRAESLVG
ncbi:ISAs1 family transposase [Streptomyces sp. NBC_01727]|uniref:ISAs1 family transposase n=1 Tax=Streptomyces sp. NBC_01727 TaxID=2975924 RepID=UPI002E1031B7|nr:ISAs1 family transposase [Streptomyces sp. NBC_01727]